MTIDVISAEDDHTTNRVCVEAVVRSFQALNVAQNWYVSGNIQVFLDSSSKPTTGKITNYNADPYPVSKVTGSVADNGDVNVTVSATRSLTIEAEIVSGSGKKTLVHWSQNLRYTNDQSFLNDTYVQVCG